MTPYDKIMLTQVLLANATDYWYEVDHNYGLGASEYFLEDATFASWQGKAAIHDFYVWRKARGDRLARHLISNFRARFETSTLAHTNNVMLLYAADGIAPLPAAAPIQIAEQEDVVVLCDDGRWRFRSRKFTNLFTGEVPTTVPPKDWFEKHGQVKPA